ncbi:Palmitoyltransferase [Coemansia nantahalensis]|uniref:Palmitoyltransferase n=1 Tax=Coemansia nantahalensis TaxID=2789366 RepID=A0ACC1K7Q1_9FUNG|nr:Palmitoyltransferase [Coemansia nantahalensis]
MAPDAAYDAEFDVGRLYVWGVSLLIGFIGYSSQLFVFWGFLGGSSLRALAVLGVFNLLLLLVYYNYYCAVTVPPGAVPLGWEPPREGANVYELKRDTLRPRYCRICKGFKPPRAHHCSDCDRCVLKLDHHCPWIGQCIGFANQAHFLRFIYTVDVTCALAMALHSMRLYELVVDSLNGTYYARQPTQTEVAFLIVNMTLLFFVLMLVGILSGYHVYLVGRNTTTIESREKERVAKLVRAKKCQPTPYPYDLGILRNFKAVFGDNVLLWWLPKRAVGTGLDFDIREGLPRPVYWPPPGYTREVGDPAKVEQRCSPAASNTIYDGGAGGARVVAEVDDDGEMVIHQYSAGVDPTDLECGGARSDYQPGPRKGMLAGFFDSGKEDDKSASGDDDWDESDDDSDDDFVGMPVPPAELTRATLASGAATGSRAAAADGEITQRRSVFAANRQSSGYNSKLRDYTQEGAAGADHDGSSDECDDDDTPLLQVVDRRAKLKTR